MIFVTHLNGWRNILPSGSFINVSATRKKKGDLFKNLLTVF